MMYEVESGNTTARLEDYIRAVRNRWPLVLALTLAFAFLGSWFAGSQAEDFTARSAVGIGPSPIGSVNDNLNAPQVERESEILASSPVAERVVELVAPASEPGELLLDLEVKFVPNSDVLQVSYTDGNAERAAEIVNAFSDVYVEFRETAADDYFQGQIDVLGGQLSNVEEEIAALNQSIEDLQADRATLVATPASEERTAGISGIDAELASLRTNLNQVFVQERTASSNLDAAVLRFETRQSTASVIRRATVPTSANGLSNTLVTLALGFLGLVFGIATAFLLERLDSTARDEGSLQLALGARVVGEIPNFGFGNRSGSASLVMLSDSTGGRIQRSKESFRRLRSSLQFLLPGVGEPDSLVVAFTSAFPGEGKSTIVANTAIAVAQGGKRVAVLSADLRRPQLEQLLELPSSPGLSEFLSASDDQPNVLETGIEGLWLIPSGAPAANSSELLGSKRFGDLIKILRADLDYVLIDTPPVLSTADALSVAQYTDGVLVVVDSRGTATTDLLQLRSELERSGASILGGVLNRDRRRRGSLMRRDRYVYSK